MANRRVLKERDLIDNPAPRIPIALVLDASPSMSGRVDLGAKVEQRNPSPIDELNRGVAQFFDEVRMDELTSAGAEIAILSYSSEVQLLCDFGPIETTPVPRIELELRIGGTNIGDAVLQALTLLENRKQAYKDAGVDYHQPWMVLMTDGQPTHGPHVNAAAKTKDLVSRRKLAVFPVGVGLAADMSVLQLFTPASALRLDGLKFAEFFAWLSQSVARVSQSMPGENTSLAPITWSTDKPDNPW